MSADRPVQIRRRVFKVRQEGYSWASPHRSVSARAGDEPEGGSPALERRELPQLYFLETGVFEGTDQCVLGEAFSEGHGIKVADAAP